MIILSFLFLTTAFLGLWIKRDPKIWGSLLGISIITASSSGLVTWIGLVILAGTILLWTFYKLKPNVWIFIALVLIGIGFKLKLLPGFPPYFITSKFAIGVINPIIGLLPLALIVPLSRDWKSILKGIAFGCAGIGLIALLAVLSGAIRINFKIPEHLPLLTYSNLFLTVIPEEGFYRGFIQNRLSNYFGNAIALLLTAALFSLTHILWSPNVGVLALTFVAGLLYGGVYIYSKKIESAIFCHFLLNFIHMTFFSYHAI